MQTWNKARKRASRGRTRHHTPPLTHLVLPNKTKPRMSCKQSIQSLSVDEMQPLYANTQALWEVSHWGESRASCTVTASHCRTVSKCSVPSRIAWKPLHWKSTGCLGFKCCATHFMYYNWKLAYEKTITLSLKSRVEKLKPTPLRRIQKCINVLINQRYVKQQCPDYSSAI